MINLYSQTSLIWPSRKRHLKYFAHLSHLFSRPEAIGSQRSECTQIHLIDDTAVWKGAEQRVTSTCTMHCALKTESSRRFLNKLILHFQHRSLPISSPPHPICSQNFHIQIVYHFIKKHSVKLPTEDLDMAHVYREGNYITLGDCTSNMNTKLYKIAGNQKPS